MKDYRYVFGPVPSRRLGLSLGISPIPPKHCNYSCVYCQLGRTGHMTNARADYFPVDEMIDEFVEYLNRNIEFDVVTIVGEGEPTLFLSLGELIKKVKEKTDKPVAVITNGALLSDENVRAEMMHADIVLPSLDAPDEETFRKINRPIGTIEFTDVVKGLENFSKVFKGQLWIEIMLVKDMNDSRESVLGLKSLLEGISYDRLFINVPVRPPAESFVVSPSEESLKFAVSSLGATAMDHLDSQGFYSDIEDDYQAILSIIGRHPMNQHEIAGFLESRSCKDVPQIFSRLASDASVEILEYLSYKTFRLRYED